jgi:hypothetical protein
MIMNRGNMVDPLDPYTIKLKAARAAAKQQESEQLEQEAQKIQYIGALYLSDAFGPCIPTEVILANLSAAARYLRNDQYIRGGYLIEGCPKDGNAGEVMLHYEGPRDPEKLFYLPEFRFGKVVDIQGNRVFKVRPCFLSWYINFTLRIRPEFVKNVQLFEEIMRFGGSFYGLGDWLKHPYYGKFTVDILAVNGESIEEEDETETELTEMGVAIE